MNIERDKIDEIVDKISTLSNPEKEFLFRQMITTFPEISQSILKDVIGQEQTVPYGNHLLFNSEAKILEQLKVQYNLQIGNYDLEIESGHIIRLRLDGQRNQIGFPKIICNLLHLSNLELSRMGIQSIPSEITNLKDLFSLDLNENEIQEISSKSMLNKMLHLSKLNLSNNKIEKIESESFPPTLHDLNLENNQLKQLPKELFLILDKPAILDNLNLRNNRLELIPTEISTIPTLRHLLVSNNILKKFPNLKNECRDFQLQNNQIETITSSITLNQYQQNNITGNPLLAWPKGWDLQMTGLVKEENEVMSCIMISYSPYRKRFKEKKRILNGYEGYTTSGNRIIVLSLRTGQAPISKTFSKFPKLKRLQLFSIGNPTNLEILGDLTQLEELQLSGNITKIPESFAKLKNLKVLEITNSKLTSLPLFITTLPNLEKYDFSGNPFKSPFDKFAQDITKIPDYYNVQWHQDEIFPEDLS